jgi:diacylglycerol kinase family enzyme
VGVEAMNIRSIGPNVPLAPRADPGDGLLDVALIGQEACAALLTHVEQRLHGGSGDPPKIPVRRARRVALNPPPDARLHVDSEPVDRDGATPLPGRVIAGAVRVMGG